MNTHDTPSTSRDRISNGVNESRTDIERIVMRRVHLIRILKLIISTVVFALLACVAALWGIGKEVWVARVFENAPTEPAQLFAFYFAAFMHARIIVEALAVLTFVSLVLLTREVIRLVLNIFAPSRT